MSPETLLLLATVCFFAMISPGPDFVVVTRNALAYPLKPALATAAGIAAGCVLHATYCLIGLAVVISQSIVAFSAIKLAGACYLVYLGIKGLRSAAGKAGQEYGIKKQQPTCGRAFLEGFFCNALNPKCAVFLLSLFTQFITAEATLLEKVQVATVFVLESAIYWPLLVLLLQRGNVREFMARWRQSIDRTCGALLVALGVRVALARD